MGAGVGACGSVKRARAIKRSQGVWLSRYGLMILAAGLLAFGGFAQSASGAADDEYRAGLVYLEDTANLDIPSALTRFHAALALDATHGPSNVFAAILEFAQMSEDASFKTMRLTFSNNMDSGTMNQYLSRLVAKGEDFDSIADYRPYVFGSTDPKASDVQAVLSKILSDSFPHIEAHLTAAANAGAIFDFPRNLIDDSPRADTYEIDKTEILALHSGLLVVKAVLVVLTSYNFDLTVDPHNVPDTISWETFKDSHPTLLRSTSTWSTAWNAVNEIDTKLYDALSYLASETDSQDSDFIRRITGSDTFNHRYINDTDFNDALVWHSDTVQDILRGDSITFDTDRAHPELKPVSIVPSKLFASPPDRTDLNDLETLRGRGLEWNDREPVDPTLGGILPGMTSNNLFLWTSDPETYFIISAAQTIDLNDYTQFGTQAWWDPAEVVDLRFEAAVPVTILRRNSSSSGNYWRVDVTPATTGHHLRLFWRGDEDDFAAAERFKIRRPGDFSGTALRAVPWKATNGEAADAGSSTFNFSTYFSSFTVSNAFLEYSADTLSMFVMPNGDYQFDSFASSTLKDASNDTTLVVGSATSLGWFLSGAPAAGSDSRLIFAFYNTLSGNKSQSLDQDFVVGVFKIQTYADTAFGTFSDYDNFLPLPGVTVTFSIYDAPSGAAGQSLDTASAVTDASGVASTRLKLGDKGGIYTVKAALSADSGGGDVLMFGTTEGIKLWSGGLWLMFALPQRPADLTAASIMASSSFTSGLWRFYEYDPTAGALSQPTALELGRGYWLKSLVDGYVGVDLATAAEPTDTQYIQLDAGWNQIGVPFEEVYPVRNLLIQTATGGTVSFDTAEDSAILRNVLYTYNGSGYEQCPDATFGVTTCYFYPFEGQWINILQACTLVIPPPAASTSVSVGGPRITTASYRSPYYSTSRSARLLATAPIGQKKYDDWTVQLIAESGKYQDMMNAVGIRSVPPPPILKAPKPPAGVHLSIKNGGAAYASAFSSPEDKPVWDLEVYSASPGSVTVRASNLSSVPSDLPLTLTDQVTRVQVDLRKSPSYTYTSGAGEVRSFQLATEEPSFLTKIIRPTACVMTRVFGNTGRATSLMRQLRDLLLRNSAGRRLTQAYYEAVP